MSELSAVELAPADHDPFADVPLARVVPTTEPQREVWLASMLGTEASLAYNESVSLQLRGPLDGPALDAALQELVDRHDALRATLSADGQSLYLAESLVLRVAKSDLGALPLEAQVEALAEARRKAVETPFDLERGPLLRVQLLRFGATEHVLLLTAHHIVCDGWSFGVLTTELPALYARHSLGARPLSPADSFADFALDASGTEHLKALDAAARYWVSIYDGSVPILELPTDRPRTAVRSFASRRIDHVLDAALVTEVRRLGAKAGVSQFAALFAGFCATLQRLSGQDDLVVGVPAAGQAAHGLTQLVGHCVNLLPVRTQIDSTQAFDAAVRACGSTILDAFEHQSLTYGSLLKKLPLHRDPGRLPLVSVMFNLDQAVDVSANPSEALQFALESNPRHFENFELFVNATPVDGSLRLECQYNTGLFEARTIKRWLGAYETLLRAAVARPSQAVGALDWLSQDDFAALRALQPESTQVDAADLMHSTFVRQAAATPMRPAVRASQGSLNYADLERHSSCLAQALRARGIGRGQRVGLCLERGPEMLVGLLGVLKSGAAYVPLDPGFPPARLSYYAEDSKLALLLADSAVPPGLATWCAEAAIPILALDSDRSWLDESADALAAGPCDALPADTAYVIYTSGSTGKPKGVCVPHRAVANFLASMRKAPGLGPQDRLAAVTTLSFDIAVLELLLPLSVGAEVVIVAREASMDGALLGALLDSTASNVMQATPGTWRILLDAGWRGSPGFKCLVGGESFPSDLVRPLLANCDEVWNLYGPTETTIWSTTWRITAADAQHRFVPIGRPIDNTSVWILDARGQPVPIGVPGEICIGGRGVALGYLDRPELTADRFVDDPFAGSPGALLYRTGDRGRWRDDGVLEHLGRLDFQVKVRGYRIELGEIEAACSEAAGVAQSVVLAREDIAGDVRLVAYLKPVADAAIDVPSLRERLKGRLPDYMLPQHLLVLDAIPLLPNGKIDRKALPAPETQPSSAAHSSVGPRNDTERIVARAMEGALSLPGIGVHDDFFALGGHSLLAMRVVTALGQAIGQRVPLRALFDAPTVSRLASWLDATYMEPGEGSDVSQHGERVARVIEVRSEERKGPASLMQQRLWLLEQLDPGRVTYSLPSAHRLNGPLDVGALERSINEMVRRQAVLRTAIVDEAGSPAQHILPSLEVSLQPVQDLSPFPSDERKERLDASLKEQVVTPIDMREAPLFRICLYRLAAQEHVLFFMPHHVIWDGWSFDLFYEEMATLYGAYSEGRESPLAPLTASYADFSRWQQKWMASIDLQQQLTHWKERLADLPEPLALPLDRPRPARMSGQGSTEPMACSLELTERTRRLGQAQGATLFMSLLAVYALLLSRVTGQRDLVIGTPVRGRDSAQVENVMGFFVNALPLRVRIDPQQSFVELLREIRKVVLDAFSAPDVPFELLVQELNVARDEARSPIYQAFFSFQDARARTIRWGKLEQEQIHLFQPGTADDLGLWFLEHSHGLAGGLTFNTDVLTSSTARQMAERFECLLRSVLADPQRPIGQMGYLPASELRLLEQWNDTQVEFEPVASVAELLHRKAQRTPDRIAVHADGSTLTYAQLDGRSNRLAHELRARGVARGALVGLCLNRSAEMLVAQLAILKSGAAYVPLDPGYPAERLAYMAEDARLALLITHSALACAIAWPRSTSLWLDQDGAALAARPESAPAVDARHDATATDPAYVIYTSGSTGKPKGVVVPHGTVLNFLASMAREPGLAPDDRLLAVTTLSFDIAVLELLLPLSVGAQVVLASREDAQDGHALMTLLQSTGVTVMQATPSTWRMLLDAGWQGAPHFKALVGGESLPADLAQALLARCATVWNMYGPTETTVWSTCWRVEPSALGIRIGRPIANTQVHILDDHGQLCAIGVQGEICIGGEGVTLGYLHRPELTAERFVVDPTRPGSRMYRTGDLGRWCHDGLLEHRGRLDFQVKVRGHRIELGEIEAACSEAAGVAQSVVLAREDMPGDVRLVAYLKPVADAAIDVPSLRERLKGRLPDYMLPQHLLVLDAIPLLPNGKIDRKALPPPSEIAAHPAPTARAPLTAIEQAVANVWQELLGIDGIRAEDNFFDLGGHSLLAMRVVTEMKSRLHLHVELRRLIYENVAQIAATPPDAVPAANEVPAATPGLVSRIFGRLGRRQ